MSYDPSPRIHTLPVLRLTKVSREPGLGFLPVDHRHDGAVVKYWREPETGRAARWKTFPKLPLLLNADGSPWAPACLYLLDRAQANPLATSSLATLAQGLRHFKSFLDEEGMAWDDFDSANKYDRPTYLYKTFLQELIDAGETKQSTASRRMSAVIGFYRFLMADGKMGFSPRHEPWLESKTGLRYFDSRGFGHVKQIITTNVSIPTPRRDGAPDETIADGARLRPLPVDEQKLLIAALKKLGNVEYELMHYIALLTGARKQTILTLRVENFATSPPDITSWPYKLRCGPGTGIDTKFNRPDVHLVISWFLYVKLHTYVQSERARRRRARSRWRSDPHNYVFLTQHGNPYYESKDDINAERQSSEMLRASKTAQGLFHFIKFEVIPEARRSRPKFSYRFHDLRATFGMNWVDHMSRERDSKDNYHLARDQLRRLMWHKDAATTERYLEYREQAQHLAKADERWSRYLVELIDGRTPQ